MTSGYRGFVFNPSRGTWSPAPPDASSREAAEACELERHQLPAGLAYEVEMAVKDASRQLGIDRPRIRWLPPGSGVRGVVFPERLDEVWVTVQEPRAARETGLHETKHIEQLKGGRYIEMKLLTMEQRQQDADAFARDWRPTQFKRGGRIELKAADDRVFEGFASRWDDVDYMGDRVQKGAFSETLKARKARPLLWNHDMGQPIGVEVSLIENATGLLGRWRLSKTAAADDAYQLLKDGAVTGLSIGFIPTKATPNDAGGKDIFACDLLEVSVVSIPALDSARIHSVKGMPSERIDIRAELERRRLGLLPEHMRRRRYAGVRAYAGSTR